MHHEHDRDERSARDFLQTCGALLLRPETTLRALAAQASVRAGAAAMGIFGLAYAGFVLALYLRGHRPTFTGNPIPAASYYLWQALFLPPLLLALWWLYGAVAQGLCRLAGGTGSRRATLATLGFAYAVPMTLGYVLPDVLVFAVQGHGALAGAMRWYAPVALVWSLALAALALRAVHGIGLVRTVPTALAAFVLQALVGGTLIR
jgi:hypothetical protein